MTKGIKIAAAVLAILTIAAAYGLYRYNEPPADTREEAADIQITAVELARAFNRDEEVANRNYVDKVLLVTGKFTRIEYDPSGVATLYLDSGNPLDFVICSFYKEETPALKNIAPGTMVRVKGICSGKLMDVVLNKCSMVK